MGNTIGAGILRAPGQVASAVGSGWAYLALWAGGALYAGLGALLIAELGTMFPRSGGQFVFARELSPFAGFSLGVSDWISTAGSAAAVSLVIAESAAALWPGLAAVKVGLAAVVVLVLALPPARGARAGSLTQDLISALKALAFLALAVACALARAPSASAPPAEGGGWVGLMAALQAIIFTYDGWAGVVYFGEELERPERDVPRALFGGVAAVALIYLLVNGALLWALGLPGIAGEPLAAGKALGLLLGASGERALLLLTLLSMLAAVHAYHLMGSRVLFALARDGLLPPRLARVSASGTPRPALALGVAVSLLFLLSGSFERVVAVCAFFFVAQYAASFAALWALRRRAPVHPRPFRAPGHPVTTLLALGGSLAFLAASAVADPASAGLALAALLAAAVVWRWRSPASGRARGAR